MKTVGELCVTPNSCLFEERIFTKIIEFSCLSGRPRCCHEFCAANMVNVVVGDWKMHMKFNTWQDAQTNLFHYIIFENGRSIELVNRAMQTIQFNIDPFVFYKTIKINKKNLIYNTYQGGRSFRSRMAKTNLRTNLWRWLVRRSRIWRLKS